MGDRAGATGSIASGDTGVECVASNMTYARIWLAAALLTATATTPLSAQPRTAFPDKRGIPLTDFPRLVPLAPNVFGYEEIRQPGFTTVSLIVVGTRGVLIADGQGSLQATQTMLDKIDRKSVV